MNEPRKCRLFFRAAIGRPGVACLAVAMIAAPASAQELPERIAIVRPSGDPVRAVAAVARARERLVPERLAPDATVESSPLSWPDLQLAAGCVSETDACFSAVAAQLEVDAIILPVLHEPEGAVILTRWRRGRGVRRERLDPVAPAASSARAPTPGRVVEPELVPRPADADPGPPILIASGAALALALGVPFAVAAEASGAAWRAIPVQSSHDAALAESTHARAMREAVVADVALGVGIGAVVTGITWWILEALGGDR